MLRNNVFLTLCETYLFSPHLYCKAFKHRDSTSVLLVDKWNPDALRNPQVSGVSEMSAFLNMLKNHHVHATSPFRNARHFWRAQESADSWHIYFSTINQRIGNAARRARVRV